jgi:tetratricopeptide (TPR) repeat protein
MIILFAAAFAAQAAPSAAPCPTVLTQAAQSCRAVEASKAGRFAEAATAFESAADLTPAGDPAKDKALAGTGLQAEQHGLALLDRARAAEAQNDLKTARAKVTEAAKTISEDPYLWFFSAALAVREEDIPTAKVAINRALAMAPDSAEVLFEAGYIAEAAGENAQARDFWSKALNADPNGPAGKAAREALAMSDAPLTVTNEVAKQPYGDGEGQDRH